MKLRTWGMRDERRRQEDYHGNFFQSFAPINYLLDQIKTTIVIFQLDISCSLESRAFLAVFGIVMLKILMPSKNSTLIKM